jgi:hypothetical protein
MAVPAPITFTAALFVTDTILNTEIRDALNFLLSPPRCSLYKSADATIGDNTWGVISFDTELYDPYTPGAHSGTSSRLTAAEDGLYAVFAKIRFGGITSGAMDLDVRKNAAAVQTAGTRLQVVTVGATTGGDEFPNVAFDAQLNAGDYIEMFGRQASGSTKTIVSAAGNTVFQFRWAAKL